MFSYKENAACNCCRNTGYFLFLYTSICVAAQTNWKR